MSQGAILKYLTTKEVQRRTGWCLAKIRMLIRNGKLPAINTTTGNRPTYEVLESDLDRLLTPVKPEASK